MSVEVPSRPSSRAFRNSRASTPSGIPHPVSNRPRSPLASPNTPSFSITEVSDSTNASFTTNLPETPISSSTSKRRSSIEVLSALSANGPTESYIPLPKARSSSHLSLGIEEDIKEGVPLELGSGEDGTEGRRPMSPSRGLSRSSGIL